MFLHVLNQGELVEALIVSIFGLYITNSNCHDPTKVRVVNMANHHCPVFHAFCMVKEQPCILHGEVTSPYVL
jgi:hypothetical protein